MMFMLEVLERCRKHMNYFCETKNWIQCSTYSFWTMLFLTIVYHYLSHIILYCISLMGHKHVVGLIAPAPHMPHTRPLESSNNMYLHPLSNNLWSHPKIVRCRFRFQRNFLPSPIASCHGTVTMFAVYNFKGLWNFLACYSRSWDWKMNISWGFEVLYSCNMEESTTLASVGMDLWWG